MDERTLRPGELKDAATLRPGHFIAGASSQESLNQSVGKWTLVRVLETREHCTLYLARSSTQENAVLKLYNGPQSNLPALKKISRLQDSRLMPILDLGTHEGKPYEVAPYMEEGTLEGAVLSDDVIMNVIVPQLTHALSVLHNNQLLHNDVKPSNIFWIRKNESIALGDFDIASPVRGAKTDGPCGTPEYMAPEVLASGSSEASPASDFCSMGITLISLLSGASPLHGKTEMQQRRAWMRGSLMPENVSAKLGTLISGLITNEPGQRMGAAGVRQWMKTYRIADTEIQLHETKQITKKTMIQALWFDHHPICDIAELIEECGKNWELGCFMLEQKQLSPFLRQFDLRHYELCSECEKAFDKSEGLFRLLHTLSCSDDFYWYGEHFDSIEDFVNRMLDTDNIYAGGTGAHFLRAGMLGIYLSNMRAAQSAIDQAERFCQTAQHHPELAMTQLLQSMGSKPELKWKDQVFHTLPELANWLIHVDGSLDEHVQQLYDSMRLDAWLSFIGEGTLLNDVRNEMKGITL
ncbi:MAG: protein kinase [Clostridia bacterium]|nr:protein kinase [Clostridia bacterium]